MKVLSLSNTPLDPKLGSGKTVVRWTEGLRRREHQCIAIGADALLPMPWRQLPGKRFALAWRGMRVLSEQIRRFRPDLVEFYGAEFGLAARWAQHRSGRPFLVAHTNGLELLAAEIGPRRGPRLTDLLHAWLNEAAFSCVDAFVAICDLDRDYIVGHGYLPSERTLVVEPGIDEEFLAQVQTPLTDRRHAVAYTGSWVPRKDTATIASVMNRVLLDDAELVFEVFGAPDAEMEIKAAFPPEQWPRVRVHGRISNAELANALGDCKVFLFPSLYEGFGMATAEAMACGCAAVVTPTGFGGSLRHDEEAMVCGFRDVEAIAQAVSVLLGKEECRLRIAESGRRRVANLTWDAQVAKLEAGYQRWLEEARPGRAIGAAVASALSTT